MLQHTVMRTTTAKSRRDDTTTCRPCGTVAQRGSLSCPVRRLKSTVNKVPSLRDYGAEGRKNGETGEQKNG
ncbi:MAG: hypothetical protein LBU62_03610 [Bacteroidales bacterium]|nr:hypothetical protein [Bacteroidales bacterium]